MSYRVKYDGPFHEYDTGRKLKMRHVLIALVIAISLCIPSIRTWLVGAILPANVEAAVLAMDLLADNIESGCDISEAVSVFCEQVVLCE